MIWYFTGGALALLIYFWGIGLAILVLPRRWRGFWPAVCPLCGVALQSLVVWIAANVGLPGTQHWAIPTLALPVAFCALAAWRVGGVRRFGELLLIGARRFWPQWLFMAVCFAFITYPLTRPPGCLNAISIGSCDAADYAGGGRVLMEFSRADRIGFLDESEVTRLGSAGNFYEFWLRLNHFTPSALLALNCPVLRCRPHELVSLLGVVLLVMNTPAVFWLARAGFRLRAKAAGAVTALYGLNPILLYAVYQTALGQLLAAPTMAILTWAGLRAFHAARGRAEAPRRRRALWAWSGLFLVCHWALLGSYNFALLFCYAPPAAWVCGRTLLTRQWIVGLRWLGFVALQILLAGLLFPARAATIFERIFLFNATRFGWKIPPFGPAGWVGVFADEKLTPAQPWVASAVALAVLTALAISAVVVLQRFRKRPSGPTRNAWLLALSFLIPAFSGYAILLADPTGNASYDAYKLFCVFYPGTLAALCLWLEPWRRLEHVTFGISRALLLLGLIALQLLLWPRFDAAVRRSNLIIDGALRDLSRVEAQHTEIRSVNVLLDSYWQRLWANTLLLRCAQYFAMPTYEGRQPTALRGEWDLRNGRLVIARTAASADTLELNEGYYLVRRAAPAWLDLTFGSSWFPAEQRRDEHWRWAGEGAEVELLNPHPYPLSATLRLRGRSLTDGRSIEVEFVAANGNGAAAPTPARVWSGEFGNYFRSSENIPLRLASGRNRIIFHSPQPARTPTPEDPRALMFALTRLELDDLKPLDPTAP